MERSQHNRSADMESVSPPQVLPQTMTGLPKAFADIYRQEFDYVCRSLRRLGARSGDLKDLVQDVFLVVLQRLPTWDSTKPLRPWLFGISFRVFSQFRQRAFVRKEDSTDLMDEISVASNMEDVLSARDARACVLLALQKIEVERRPVFIMHELDGCPIPEVAQTLGLPLNTAYSRLRLAREEFKAAIERMRAKGVQP